MSWFGDENKPIRFLVHVRIHIQPINEIQRVNCLGEVCALQSVVTRFECDVTYFDVLTFCLQINMVELQNLLFDVISFSELSSMMLSVLRDFVSHGLALDI